MRRALSRSRLSWITQCTELLQESPLGRRREEGRAGGCVDAQQTRCFAKKIKRKKGPVEPLGKSPNSVAALLSERPIPQSMDLREVWDKIKPKKTRQLEKLEGVDSTTRFEARPLDGSRESEMELLLEKTSSQLTAEDVNRYYRLEKGYLQEAFREFYKFTGSDGHFEVPDKGCRALYREVQLTGSTSVLHRHCTQQLRELLAEGDPGKIWLEGRRGSGKSMALASAVEWARQNNWLVLYLPSASALVSDPFFVKREDADMYDTIVSAKDILKSVYSIYGGDSSPLASLNQTQAMPSLHDFGQTLDDLCRIGLATGDPVLACDAAVQLLQEFLYGDHNVEKLVVVDDYNALYWNTQYFHWKTYLHKVMIPADNVTLVKAFRILGEAKDLNCQVLTAPTESGGISPRVWIPKEEPIEPFTIPPFTEDEIHCTLCHYWQKSLIQPVDAETVRRLFFVTGGNMHDLQGTLSLL